LDEHERGPDSKIRSVVAAAWQERKVDTKKLDALPNGFVDACPLDEIPENCVTSTDVF